MQKKSFLKDSGLSFGAKDKVLNSFKSRLFLIKNLDKVPTRKPTLKPAAEPTPKPATEVKPRKHKNTN